VHELPITQRLLNTALERAEQAGARHILRLNLVVSERSAIVGESVRFYWDIISRGTMAEGAKLHFEWTPVQMECLACDSVFPLDGQYACPACGQGRVAAVNGDVFQLESIDVE